MDLIQIASTEIKDKIPNHFTLIGQEFIAVFSETPLSAGEKKRLARATGGHFVSEISTGHPEHEYAFWVTPRFGTVSPWASKVQDWLAELGFTGIRMERLFRYVLIDVSPRELKAEIARLWDPLTESFVEDPQDLENLFVQLPARPLVYVDVLGEGIRSLTQANEQAGWGLSPASLEWIADYYLKIQRNPTDAELMMYAQVNSEHCRHLIFKARWDLNGQIQKQSLMDHIRRTHEKSPHQTWVAYHDNAAVISGVGLREQFSPDPETQVYGVAMEPNAFVIKVETHNHPTGIAPHSGAATGVGGEIRDEGATGTGASSRAGLAGYMVNHFACGAYETPGLSHFKQQPLRPPHFASALQIMREAPIGAARYGNEFGRPQVTGFFRTFTQATPGKTWGYAKPIMLAGGIGTIRSTQLFKKSLPVGAWIVVLGGPGFRIGLGGGSASSQQGGGQSEALDFASVQRANPELERRAQEAILACTRLGESNPILSVHDVGAGGLSNAIPELVHQAGRGARVELSAVLSGDPSLSPMEIWCNESQERYVLAIHPAQLQVFQDICEREKCSYAVVGEVTGERDLKVEYGARSEMAVDLPLDFVLENEERREIRVACLRERPEVPFSPEQQTELALNLKSYLSQVLRYPAVANKSFLINIADRTVGGLTIQDQMVGRFQYPMADCAIIADDARGVSGQAMALGERAPVALLDPVASVRIAVGEVILNLLSAPVVQLSDIRLSGNWMASTDDPAEALALWDAVSALSEFCQHLEIAVPVGKDSLSMKTAWQEERDTHEVRSPLSFVASGFVNLPDVAGYLTPDWGVRSQDPILLWVDLGQGRSRLGGSVLAQIMGVTGGETPDIIEPDLLLYVHQALKEIRRFGGIWAYHDVSDGGLWACLCEMAFANHVGLSIDFTPSSVPVYQSLFSEELGMVWAIDPDQLGLVQSILERFKLGAHTRIVASVQRGEALRLDIKQGEKLLESVSLDVAFDDWRALSLAMARERDEPTCIDSEERIKCSQHTGVWFKVLDGAWSSVPSWSGAGRRPRAAILRSVGTNGHVEMARAFTEAGFEAVDVHLSDLQSGALTLESFQASAFCGGFSYGDVLGAGRAVASIILENSRLRDVFSAFFARSETLTLGVCNGCQILSLLKPLIPGGAAFPLFKENVSRQFEARLLMVRIEPSRSIWFQGMQGWELPIVVSHGEGRVVFESTNIMSPALVYLDGLARPTEHYPSNPNGSPGGATAFCSGDGRVMLMMPHPERVAKRYQLGQLGPQDEIYSPWFQMFKNARGAFK